MATEEALPLHLSQGAPSLSLSKSDSPIGVEYKYNCTTSDLNSHKNSFLVDLSSFFLTYNLLRIYLGIIKL